jgi:hypothetical protein
MEASHGTWSNVMKMVGVCGRWWVAGMLAVTLAPAALGGCSRSLFRDPPRARSPVDKYYDGDSAVEATETRRRVSQMGFGFPTGPN